MDTMTRQLVADSAAAKAAAHLAIASTYDFLAPFVASLDTHMLVEGK